MQPPPPPSSEPPPRPDAAVRTVRTAAPVVAGARRRRGDPRRRARRVRDGRRALHPDAPAAHGRTASSPSTRPAAGGSSIRPADRAGRPASVHAWLGGTLDVFTGPAVGDAAATRARVRAGRRWSRARPRSRSRPASTPSRSHGGLPAVRLQLLGVFDQSGRADRGRGDGRRHARCVRRGLRRVGAAGAAAVRRSTMPTRWSGGRVPVRVERRAGAVPAVPRRRCSRSGSRRSGCTRPSSR